MSEATNPLVPVALAMAQSVQVSDKLTIRHKGAGHGDTVALFVPGWAMAARSFEKQLADFIEKLAQDNMSWGGWSYRTLDILSYVKQLGSRCQAIHLSTIYCQHVDILPAAGFRASSHPLRPMRAQVLPIARV